MSDQLLTFFASLFGMRSHMLKIEMMSMKLEDNDADETNGDDVGPEESTRDIEWKKSTFHGHSDSTTRTELNRITIVVQ